MERLTCNELKIYDGCFVNMAKREESRKYSLLIESAPTYEEIYKKLTEYENLEEQGLLLRLPCNVGDTVYLVDFEENDYDEATVLSIEIDTRENRILINSDYETGTWSEDSYVFYSQEEAELELANRQQSHAEAIMDERNGR